MNRSTAAVLSRTAEGDIATPEADIPRPAVAAPDDGLAEEIARLSAAERQERDRRREEELARLRELAKFD